MSLSGNRIDFPFTKGCKSITFLKNMSEKASCYVLPKKSYYTLKMDQNMKFNHLRPIWAKIQKL